MQSDISCIRIHDSKFEDLNHLKIENVSVTDADSAFRGMRNPMQSWDKSNYWDDLALAKKLASLGDEHGKVLRGINISFDMTAPTYALFQFDTYKVGVVCNSTSKMHKITSRELTLDDFEKPGTITEEVFLKRNVEALNFLINGYAYYEDEEDKENTFRAILRMLPSGYLQKRTIHTNYAVLRRIYHQRKNHRLPFWRDFCSFLEGLPFSELITCEYKQKLPEGVPVLVEVDGEVVEMQTAGYVDGTLKVKEKIDDEAEEDMDEKPEKDDLEACMEGLFDDAFRSFMERLIGVGFAVVCEEPEDE